MVEPNRLREASVPNTLGLTPPSVPVASDALVEADDAEWDRALDENDGDLELHPGFEIGPGDGAGAADDLRAEPGLPAGRGRRGFLAGLVLAATGVPAFFSDSLTSEELGIALICLGIGVALLSVLTAAGRREVVASRRSVAVAVTTTAVLPHTAVLWIAALGLLGFGILMLTVVFGIF